MKKITKSICFLIALICGFGAAAKNIIPIGNLVSIPLFIDMNNQFDDFTSVHKHASVTITAPNDSVVFENKAYGTDYRVTWKPKLLLYLPGHYNIDVTFYTDSVTEKVIKENFDVNGDETKIRLQITMQFFRTEYHGLVVTRYLGNKYHAELTRNWNPQKQFERGKFMKPLYIWTNAGDSTIYGVQRGAISGSDATMFKENTKKAFIHFEKFTSLGWQYINCYGNYLQGGLTKGQTGGLLKDTMPACPCKTFLPNEKYRVIVEYGINDGFYDTTKGTGAFEDRLYAEEYIYQVTDEFTIK